MKIKGAPTETRGDYGHCSGTWYDSSDLEQVCRRSPALNTRWVWRFDDDGNLVNVKYHLCAACADAWDEVEEEAAAEARMS